MTRAVAWREYAKRLLAQATVAQSQGDTELAEMFTALAMRYMDEAAEIEASEAPAPHAPPPTTVQPVAQQQQQAQPKKDDKK